MNETTPEALLDRFFEQARAVQFGERDRIEVSVGDVQELVSNDALRVRFAKRFRLEAQSDELRALIILYFKSVAGKERSLPRK